VGVFESWIGLVDAAGGEVTELAGQRPGGAHPYNSDPAWSPAGDRIACAIGAVIGTYPAAGGPPSYPNANLTNARDPAWSPDGRRFAFRQGDGIYTMPVGGGAAVRLTTGFDSDPAWSPDGRWVAFESLRSGNRDIWLVPSAGGEVVQLTHAPGSDAYPAWSPDGRLIAFASDRAGNDDIWVVRVANGAASQVTTDPASDHSPGWSPDGTRIAFASDRSGALNIWIASDLRTVAVEPATWSRIKLGAR
jgi:Tol biopolymer transport system component